MKTNKHFLTLTILGSIILYSCTKEKQPNGISYQLTSSAVSAIISGSSTNGSLQWTRGFASVVEIEFEAKKNNTELEFKSEIKQKIDLFAPLSTLGVIIVPSGTYEDIEYEVEVQPNGVDAAFQLNGNFINRNGVITPVIFKINSMLEIEAEQNNITIVDGTSLTALTTLNLALITMGVTESMLDNATRTGGVIEISVASNTSIYNIIFDNLRNCGGVEIK